jgi:hypothetical protein
MMRNRKLPHEPDLWICLFGGVLLVGHALLAPLVAVPLLRVGLGLVLLAVPGYSFARLIGLDRYGLPVLAGLALPFSLALLAIVGTAIWLVSHQFAGSLIEGVLGGITLALSGGALMRRAVAPPEAEQHLVQALALVFLPLTVAAVIILLPLPTSPATHYTEFALVSQQPVLTAAITNHEGESETYYIIADQGALTTRLPPVTLAPEAQWIGPISRPPAAAGRIRLRLDRNSDDIPYRTLTLNAGE